MRLVSRFPQAFLLGGLTLTLLALPVGNASAQLSKDEQGCINTANKGLGKYTKDVSKLILGCVKDFQKSKIGSADACIGVPGALVDVKGKLLKRRDKAAEAYTKKCDDKGVPVPPLGPLNSSQVDDAAEIKEVAIYQRFFGASLDTAIALQEDPTKDLGKCQEAVLKDAYKCEATKIKAFISCKKDGLKGKIPPGLIQTPTELQDICLGTGVNAQPDAKGKIAGKCSDPLKGGIYKSLLKKCIDKGVDLTVAFGDGECATQAATSQGAQTVNALGDCLEHFVECEVCAALNAADGLNRDCDLFDNGVSDGSCVLPGCRLPVGAVSHSCTLDTGSLLTLSSSIPFPPFAATGTIDVDCNSDGGATEDCTCDIDSITPIEIASVGFVCITAGPSCATSGALSCMDDATTPGYDLEAFHTIDTCSSNAECASDCATHCSGLGQDVAEDSAGCEGFCNGGANDEAACTADADCPGGFCPGQDTPLGPHNHPIALGGLAPPDNACQCTCIDRGVGATGAKGSLTCDLSTSIAVETALPCDGADTLITIGSACIPLTTGTATGIIQDANYVAAATLPSGGAKTATGALIDPDTLLSTGTSGMTMVGQIAAYDSAIGDLEVEVEMICQ